MVAVSPSLTAREALANEWMRRSPSTPEEIAAFYRDSQHMGADLDAWHQTPERQEWTDFIVNVAKNNGVTSVLDVGAGGGQDLRALKEAIPYALLDGVEPNASLRDALPERVGQYADIGLHGEAYSYDLVLCIDVLEHVPDPEALLTQIMDRVKVGGILIEASATADQDTPLHLPELEGWEPTDTLQKNGFVPVETMGRLAVWQKHELEVMPTVLVVAHREVCVPTIECLFSLIGEGWPVGFVSGDALIDRARAKAVSSWYLNETSDVFLMIDDDIVFKAEDAARVVALAREKKSIACAAYPVADGGHLASRAWPGTLLDFGSMHDAREIRWPATGFMAVHRDVITALVESLGEPCYPDQPDRFWPMFTPFKLGPDYLSEDYAFGQRALELGFKTWLDPKSILIHMKYKGLSVFNMPGATVRNRDELSTL
jgi:SAM-dependent methyltransferase